jgi:hypothetical protein
MCLFCQKLREKFQSVDEINANFCVREDHDANDRQFLGRQLQRELQNFMEHQKQEIETIKLEHEETLRSVRAIIEHRAEQIQQKQSLS